MRFKVGDRVRIKEFAGAPVYGLGVKTNHGIVTKTSYYYGNEVNYVYVQVENRNICCLHEELELLPDMFELWEET